MEVLGRMLRLMLVVIFVFLVFGPQQGRAAQAPLDNMDFSTNLDGWEIDLFNGHGDRSVTWSSDYGGSAKLYVSGAPGGTDLSQFTKSALNPGDRITVDVYHTYLGNFSHWELMVDGLEALFRLNSNAADESLTWVVDDYYPIGTRLAIVAAAWPGTSTTWVKEIRYTPTPLPSALLLFSSGLLLLHGARSRKRKGHRPRA